MRTGATVAAGRAAAGPSRWQRIADRAFYPLLTVYGLYTLGWLVLGLIIGLVTNLPSLHVMVEGWHAADPTDRIAAGLQVGILHSETTPQFVFDYLFSLLNVGLSAVLLRSAPKDWTVRLLAVGMIGSSGAFNLQAHAEIYAVQDAFGINIGWWHTALLHGVGGICYVFALLMFPTGRLGLLGQNGWMARTLVGVVVATTVGLLSISTASYSHPVSFLVFFGAVAPMAGVAAQLRRYAKATTAEARQQSRVLLWTLFLALGAAVVLSALTILGATTGPAGATMESSDSLIFGICRAVFTVIPLALLVGVLRFRLWDVELLLNRTFVYGMLTVLIGGLYVAVVVVADWLLGLTSRVNLPVQLLGAAAVVIALRPVQTWISRLADRFVYGRRPTPHDVLARLSALSRTTVDGVTVLPLLASTTAEGLQVAGCEVRLELHDGTQRRYRWPAALDSMDQGRPVEVRYRDERMGEIVIDRSSAAALAPQQRKLLGDLARGAGLVMHTARLTIELEDRLAMISARAKEITASRRRIIREQEAERRNLERNLHDGAQPQLVALQMTIGLLTHLIDTGAGTAAAELVEHLDAQLADADNDLAELSNGLYPPLLREQGFLPALRRQAQQLGINSEFRTSTVPDGDGIPTETEAAVCLAVMEAMQNVAKHAPAARATVDVAVTANELRFSVADDGPGFALANRHGGVGLQSMADRIAAAGGEVRIESAVGAGTTISGHVPLRTQHADEPDLGILRRRNERVSRLKDAFGVQSTLDNGRTTARPARS